MASTIRPGSTVSQDPNDEIVRHFDWTAWLRTREGTPLIDTADVFVDPTPDVGDTTPLTVDHVTVLDDDKRVQFRTQGGTVGTTYAVTCRIVTDGDIVETKDQSFRVKIASTAGD